MRSHACVCKFKYPFYNPRCFFVHDQLVVVVGGFAVADRVKGRTVQPRLCPRTDRGTDFAGIIPAVKFVHHIFQSRYIVVLVGGVHTVIDCDIPHILHREVNLRKVSYFQMVTPQTG